MPRKSKKVHVQCLHIDFFMRRALSSIHNNVSPLSAVSNFMSIACDFFYRICYSKDIANLRNRNNFCLGIYFSFYFLLRNFCGRIALKPHKFRAFCIADHLPRKNIRMMLHAAYNNFVPRLNFRKTKSVCNKIQAFRSIARKNNFRRLASIKEFCNKRSCVFIVISCPYAQSVKSAQRIGVVFSVKVSFRLNYTFRPMSCSRAVQVNKPFVFWLAEYLKIAAYFLCTEHSFLVI